MSCHAEMGMQDPVDDDFGLDLEPTSAVRAVSAPWRRLVVDTGLRGAEAESAWVTVTDQRGGVTTWTASVISTAFTPPSGPADPASNLSYGAGVVTVTSTVVATVLAASDLTGVSTVVTGASSGISTASWNPTISVVVPANYAPGVYSATITHSVA